MYRDFGDTYEGLLDTDYFDKSRDLRYKNRVQDFGARCFGFLAKGFGVEELAPGGSSTNGAAIRV